MDKLFNYKILTPWIIFNPLALTDYHFIYERNFAGFDKSYYCCEVSMCAHSTLLWTYKIHWQNAIHSATRLRTPIRSKIEFSSAQGAMLHCDNKLIELGYTLLSKERYELLQTII